MTMVFERKDPTFEPALLQPELAAADAGHDAQQLQHAQALDPGKVVSFKWKYRALGIDELREVAKQHGALPPEAAGALDEVLAEKGIASRTAAAWAAGAATLPSNLERDYRGLRGFIVRHYNGDYPLARSYWVHTFLLSTLGSLTLLPLLAWAAANLRARYVSLLMLTVVVVLTAMWIWGIVGTWASSNKHVGRGGRRFWAGAAKAAIVLGVLRNIGELMAMAPQLVEHIPVALGAQPGEAVQFVVRADGKSLLVRGGINDDTAEGLEQALDQAPTVTTVVLESAGGWTRQGRMLADVISRRGLDTYVENECSSACTIAFLAGRDRAVDPAGRLGFHAFRGIGVRSRGSSEGEQEVYGKAGLGSEFVRRIQETPHDTMWYPTHAQLLQERVLTRLSQGGETAALATTSRSRREIADGLSTVALYASVKAHQPAEYERLVDTAWRAVQNRETDREVFGAIGAEMRALTSRLLPTADDATLTSYVVLLADQAQQLQQVAPQACAKLVFGQPRKVHNLRELLPKPLLEREQRLLQRIVETSAPAHALVLSQAERAASLRTLLGALPPREARVITTLENGAHRPRDVCAAGVALLDALLALPPRQRARQARQLFMD